MIKENDQITITVTPKIEMAIRHYFEVMDKGGDPYGRASYHAMLGGAVMSQIEKQVKK